MLNGRWPHCLSTWNWVHDAKVIRDGGLVSIVSYSRPSFMIIASRTQFHVESSFQPGEGPSRGLLRDYESWDGTTEVMVTPGYCSSPWQCLLTDCDTTADTGGVVAWAPVATQFIPTTQNSGHHHTMDTMAMLVRWHNEWRYSWVLFHDFLSL